MIASCTDMHQPSWYLIQVNTLLELKQLDIPEKSSGSDLYILPVKILLHLPFSQMHIPMSDSLCSTGLHNPLLYTPRETPTPTTIHSVLLLLILSTSPVP